MRGLGAVSNALDEMNAGYIGESLQVVHGENQRPVHHAVNHEPMFPGIDFRNVGTTVCSHVMERRRRYNPHRVLQRGQYVKHEPKGIRRGPLRHRYAYRSHETGALAIGDQFLTRTFSAQVAGRLAAGGPQRARRQTGRRGATFQKSPSIRFFRIHGSLLQTMKLAGISFLAFRSESITPFEPGNSPNCPPWRKAGIRLRRIPAILFPPGCYLLFSPSRQAITSSSPRTASSTRITGCTWNTNAGSMEQNL